MSRNLRDAKIHFLYGIYAGDQKNLTNIITYESIFFLLMKEAYAQSIVNIFAINPNFLLLFHIIFISMIVSRLVANAQYPVVNWTSQHGKEI